ncbi:MAG: hypothetical protein ABR573_01540 [Candidatus Dormibacteria bacterium]
MGLRGGFGVVVLGLSILQAGCGSTTCAGASCGAAKATPAATSGATPAATASAHGWTTALTLQPPAGTVDVTVKVTGPLQVDGGCVPSLVVWAVGPDGRRLDPTPAAGIRCHAISIQDIADGQVSQFTATLPRLPSGKYAVHGLLMVHLPIGAGARPAENIPVATITIP